MSIESTGNQGTSSEDSFLADEINVPKISLNAPNDKVVASMENLSSGFRFDGISDRCSWHSKWKVQKGNTVRYVRIDTPVAWSST